MTRRMLLGVVCLALLLRVIAACCLTVACDDAYYYFSIAGALDRGDFDAAFYYLHLNTFPAILLALHKLGLEWETAGRLWNVLCGTLAVLPLFGWTRRLAGERLAILCAFLYAVHPDLVEYSAEPIREPAFWLLFNSGLFALVRAFQQGEWKMFALAGVMGTLAAHTRVEGWFLTLGALTLFAVHWFSHPQRRWRNSGGLLLCLSMTPALLCGVNVALWKTCQRTEWGSLVYAEMAWDWVKSLNPVSLESETPTPAAGKPPGAQHGSGVKKGKKNDSPGSDAKVASQEQSPPKPARTSRPGKAAVAVEIASRERSDGDLRAASDGEPAPMPIAAQDISGESRRNRARRRSFSAWHVKRYLEDLLKTFQPHHLALTLLGLWHWRAWLRRRELALLVALIAVGMLAVWIRLWHTGHINGRYFFAPMLVSLPFAALGGWLVIHRLMTATPLARWSPASQWRAAAALLLLMAAISAADAAQFGRTSRLEQAAAGRYLQERYGPFDSALVRRKALRLGFLALGDNPLVEHRAKRFEQRINEWRPELLLLAPEDLAPASVQSAIAAAQAAGYRQIPLPPEILEDDGEWVALLRPDSMNPPRPRVAAQEQGIRH